MVVQINNFLNNVSGDQDKIESFNQSNCALICTMPNNNKDMVMAVNAATGAFKNWCVTTLEYRAHMLHKISDGIEKRLVELTIAESNDQGKTLFVLLNAKMPRDVYNFRILAAVILNHKLNHKNQVIKLFKNKILNYATQSPVSAAVLISPWNLPLYFTWKIAPAIAAR